MDSGDVFVIGNLLEADTKQLYVFLVEHPQFPSRAIICCPIRNLDETPTRKGETTLKFMKHWNNCSYTCIGKHNNTQWVKSKRNFLLEFYDHEENIEVLNELMRCDPEVRKQLKQSLDRMKG